MAISVCYSVLLLWNIITAYGLVDQQSVTYPVNEKDYGKHVSGSFPFLMPSVSPQTVRYTILIYM